jgi:aminoglycoside phosphotransferase (APT) family kinase protein
VAALQAIDPAGGPPAERGVPLARRDGATRQAIEALGRAVDTAAVTAACDAVVRVPACVGPPVWVHGELSPGNVLTRGGRLVAVVDFGGLGVGDPACDLIVAWNVLPASARSTFRAAAGADDATWARGRGWALSVALVQLP